MKFLKIVIASVLMASASFAFASKPAEHIFQALNYNGKAIPGGSTLIIACDGTQFYPAVNANGDFKVPCRRLSVVELYKWPNGELDDEGECVMQPEAAMTGEVRLGQQMWNGDVLQCEPNMVTKKKHV